MMKPFTYEEALAIQMEGALEVMNQANQELSTVMQRVHDYLKEQKKGRGRASEEDGPPPGFEYEEERT